MNKLVLLALVAVFALAAAQDITDIKLPTLKNKTNQTLPIMTRTMVSHANVSGKANLTNSLPVVRGCPNKSYPLLASSQPLVFKLNRSLLNRSNRANRTNKTNKTGGIPKCLNGGFQAEESSETNSLTDDFEAYHLARRNNKTNQTNKTNSLINRQNKTKNTTTCFFETLKNWLFGGNQQQEETDVEEIEDFRSTPIGLDQIDKTFPKKNKTKSLSVEEDEDATEVDEDEFINDEEIEDLVSSGRKGKGGSKKGGSKKGGSKKGGSKKDGSKKDGSKKDGSKKDKPKKDKPKKEEPQIVDPSN